MPGSLGQLGAHEALAVLGSGSMGTVLKCLDPLLRRTVAVKVMAQHLAGSPSAQQRFLREAQAVAALDHENIVRVHAVYHAPVPHIVMELIDGRPLEHLLSEGKPLPVEQAVRVGIQIARALAAAHDRGVIHRDIKPANVLIDGRGHVKVADFGLARAADDSSLTHHGQIVGTPLYMAPEQARGDQADHRSDLFSLGNVLYALCAGHAAFRAPTSLAVLKRVCEETPRPLREVNPAVPPWLEGLIARLLEKAPQDRFQSAAEVAALLEQGITSPTPPPTAPPRRRSLWWWALGLLILAVGTFFAFRQFIVPETMPPLEVPPDCAPGDDPDEPEPTLLPKFVNEVGMEFVLVPRGVGWLGGGGGKPGTIQVRIRRSFYLGATEVTQKQWQAVMGSNPSYFSREGHGHSYIEALSDDEADRMPVEDVEWEKAQTFLTTLNRLYGQKGWEYRLPREVEWEYACRGGPSASPEGSEFDYYLGVPTNELGAGDANISATGLSRPCPVASYAPNRLGLYDMHGNVAELCHDLIAESGAGRRTVRGGNWEFTADRCTSAVRQAIHPVVRHNSLGLRVARVQAVGK
jgi:formylglycine-generating enzyme required for sulfatase activity